MNSIQKFNILKPIKLLILLFEATLKLLFNHIDCIYYPPAGESTYGVYRDIISLIYLRLFKKKIVFHFHPRGLEKIYNASGILIKFLFKYSHFNSDLTIILSQSSIDQFKFIKSKKIKVIPNGIEDNFEIYKNEFETKDIKCPKILYVGNIIESKGILILLDALYNLYQRNFSFSAHFIGGYNDKNLQIKVQNHPIYSKVKFHGILSGQQKWHMYSNASIFCFPTFYENENQPVVLLEAMQFQLPIVSTNWAAIPEMIIHEHNGYLVKPRDITELEYYLEKLIESPNLRKSLGEKGREIFLKNFSGKAYTDLFEKTILEIL